jgi:hypothetical protein
MTLLHVATPPERAGQNGAVPEIQMAHDLRLQRGQASAKCAREVPPFRAGEESASLGIGVKFSVIRRPNPNGLFAISVGAARPRRKIETDAERSLLESAHVGVR